MINLKSQITGVMILGVLALIAGYFSHLALTDIYHAESDLTLEWRIVQIAALIILVFIGSSLVVLHKSKKSVTK